MAIPNDAGDTVDFTYTTAINYSAQNVNNSQFWRGLATPADISTGDLTDDDTYVEVSGDTMTGDLHITGFLYAEDVDISNDLEVTDNANVGGNLNVTQESWFYDVLNVFGLAYFYDSGLFYNNVYIYNATEPVFLEMESENSSEGVQIRLLEDGTNDLYIYTYGSTATGTYYGYPRANSSYIDAQGARFILGTFDSSPMYFATDRDARFELTSTGDLIPVDDNYYDIGNSTNRIQDIFVVGEDGDGGIHFAEDDGSYGNLSMNDAFDLLWNGVPLGNSTLSWSEIENGTLMNNSWWDTNYTANNDDWSNRTNLSYLLTTSWTTNYTANNDDWMNRTNLSYVPYAGGLIRGGFLDRYDSGVFNGSLYTNNAISTNSISNSLFQVISDTRGTPQFQIQNGGANQASFIARSFLVVNQDNALLNSSQNGICSDWGLNHIDCNTSTTGADLGVTDDIEALGVIYSGRGYKGHAGDSGTYLELREHVSPKATGSNASYSTATTYFCDFVADSFVNSGGWIRLVAEETDLEGASADINSYINSSCITLKYNPAWTDIASVDWKQLTSPELIVNSGGFFEYYVGNDTQSTFKIKTKDGTGFTSFHVDDTAGADQHQAMTIDMGMKNYEGQVALNIFMQAKEEIIDKSLTAILIEADATNLNGSDGVYIDAKLIGAPLSAGHFDGMHFPAGLTHIIEIGSADTIMSSFYNGVDITANVKGTAADVTVFEADNDVIYIGASTNFTTLSVALSTGSSTNIAATYSYCNGAHVWVPLLGVTDTTDGWKVPGTMSFPSPIDRGNCNQETDGTPFSETTNYTYIAITRTRNNIVTAPVIDILGIGGASENMFLQDDMLRLHPVNSAPEACSATILGAIYFDLSEDDMCVCKSTGWKVMADGTDCT